jgi:hypothetical protein
MSRVGLVKPLLSVFLPNAHTVLKCMPETRREAVIMTNSCALVLSSIQQHGSTATSKTIANNKHAIRLVLTGFPNQDTRQPLMQLGNHSSKNMRTKLDRTPRRRTRIVATSLKHKS